MPMFYKKCPICETKWSDNLILSEKCPNGCYESMTKIDSGYHIIKIFDTSIKCPKDRLSVSREAALNRINNLIKYYRENDKYLAEILAKKE